jgi:hypothetical protein
MLKSQHKRAAKRSALTQMEEPVASLVATPAEALVPRVRVAIIGTAGRSPGVKPALDAALFARMCDEAVRIITVVFGLGDWRRICLVSGGAAWADHVAVELCRRYKTQGATGILHLPCPLERTSPAGAGGAGARFVDTKSSRWHLNPGRTANRYHAAFTWAMSYDTIAQLLSTDNVVLDTTSRGFHARNNRIAEAQYMIAFCHVAGGSVATTEAAVAPPKGGTLDTWQKFGRCHDRAALRAARVLVSLAELAASPEERTATAEEEAEEIENKSSPRKKQKRCLAYVE